MMDVYVCMIWCGDNQWEGFWNVDHIDKSEDSAHNWMKKDIGSRMVEQFWLELDTSVSTFTKED